MKMRTRFCLIAAWCLIPTLTLAQEASQENATSPENAASQEDAVADRVTVDQWKERLESNKFSVRNEATRQLRQRGLSVIDQVQEIALKGTTESAGRAFEILKGHHASEDFALQAAAAKALKQIAETPGHARAEAAAEILDPPDEPRDRHAPFRIPMAVPGNLRIQIQGRAIGGNGGKGTRVQVKIVNGKKDITVEENGKKLRVFENDKGIRVEKTDANGKTESQQYKDQQELKAKDPEAHEKFHNNGRGLNIQIRANPWRGGQPPGINPPIKQQLEQLRKQEELRRKQVQQEQQRRLEDLRKRREESLKRLRGLPPTTPQPDDPQPIKEIKTKSLDVIEV
jgi:hypothetical protein